MFTAPFTSAFIVAPHDSQTYKPRSTRFASRLRPQHEHVFDVSRSLVRSTRMPCSSALYSSKRGEAVELPSVEFLVPTLTPVPRVTVLVFTNLAQVTDGDTTNLVVDTLFNDVLGEGACRKWSFRRDNFCRARRARRDGPFSPSVSYSSRVK